jgi:hypothetical protein
VTLSPLPAEKDKNTTAKAGRHTMTKKRIVYMLSLMDGYEIFGGAK